MSGVLVRAKRSSEVVRHKKRKKLMCDKVSEHKINTMISIRSIEPSGSQHIGSIRGELLKLYIKQHQQWKPDH